MTSRAQVESYTVDDDEASNIVEFPGSKFNDTAARESLTPFFNDIDYEAEEIFINDENVLVFPGDIFFGGTNQLDKTSTCQSIRDIFSERPDIVVDVANELNISLHESIYNYAKQMNQ